MDKIIEFTKEVKIAAVKRYIEDCIGCTSLAREVGCHERQILRWVYAYREYGEKALLKSIKSYSLFGLLFELFISKPQFPQCLSVFPIR